MAGSCAEEERGTSGCGPGAPDHRLIKERQRRCRRYPRTGERPDGFVWPPGRVRKRGVPGAAELIAHAAPSGDQAPRPGGPEYASPTPALRMGIVSAAESSATGVGIGPTR